MAVDVSGLGARVVLNRGDGFRLDVAISIPAERTVALLGPNGAGKSTLVSAIAGLMTIDEGTISIGSQVVDDPATGVYVPPERRGVGVVFQDYLLFPHLSVLDNVAFGLRSSGIARRAAAEESRRWLARVGLDGAEGKRPRDLSGGEAQRVGLARALVTRPRALLLDEPLGALDVTTRSELRGLLDEHLRSFPGPRMLITHEPTEAFLLADEIHVIENGEISQSGTAEDIRLRPQTRYAADLAGSNLVEGTASRGLISVGAHVLHPADAVEDGRVLVVIQPSALAVHIERPGGSPRNVWRTKIERVEPLGTRVRLRTGDPLPLTVELTQAARDELGLEPGSDVWLAVKATEIEVQSAV